jgi:hypothetical protein
MLSPLLRQKDYDILSHSEVVYIDCNNRFPYPKSNHQSIVNFNANSRKESDFIKDWIRTKDFSYFKAPHTIRHYNAKYHQYFIELASEFSKKIPVCVFDFIQKTKIPNVMMVHYGGMEDKKFHQQEILSDEELVQWTNAEAAKIGIPSSFQMPALGEVFQLG